MLSRFNFLIAVILAACGPASAQVKVQIGDLAQSLNEIGSRTMIDQGIDRKYVIVPVASPIRSIADLKGKKVGSFAGAAGTATVLFRVITSKFHGFDPAKTSDLQFAGPGLLPTLLDKGEIDAAVMFDPLAAKLEGSGKYRSIGNLADAYKAGTGDDFLSVTRRTTTSCERSRRR